MRTRRIPTCSRLSGGEGMVSLVSDYEVVRNYIIGGSRALNEEDVHLVRSYIGTPFYEFMYRQKIRFN